MWSTEQENDLNIIKPLMAKGSAENEEDFGNIKLRLHEDHEGEVLDGKQMRRSAFDRKDDTVDALSNIKGSAYIGSCLPLNESENMSLEMTKSKKLSTRHFKEELLMETNDESSRIVKIVRNKCDPLGFYIRQGDGITNKTGIFVSRILRGSLVDCSGILKTGDEILKVNNIDVKGFSLSEVVKLIQVPIKFLILTVRASNRHRYPRPKISSRHSSPSLSVGEKDSKKCFKSEAKVRLLKSDGFNQMAINNLEQEIKQRHDYDDRMKTNKPPSDLFKNTSTIHDLFWLLRAESKDFESPHYEKEGANLLERDSTCKTEKRRIDSVYAQPRTPKLDKPMSYSSQSHIQANEFTSRQYPLIKMSTMTPSTAINLLFDDEDIHSTMATQLTISQASTASHPYYDNQINKSQENVDDVLKEEKIPSQPVIKVDTLKVPSRENVYCSRSGSRGSSTDGSPKVRRKLPSLPVEGGVIKNKIVQPKDKYIYPKKNLLIPGNAENKHHRKLPIPPVSPKMDHEGHSFESLMMEETGPRSLNVLEKNARRRNKLPLKELGAEEPDKACNQTDKTDDNNIKSASKLEPADSAYVKTKDNSKAETDEKTQGNDKPDAHVFRPTPYRRSQSQYSDFFEQQKHSMFLQSYAFGTIKPFTSGPSNKESSIPSVAEDLSHSFQRKRVDSEVGPKKSVLEKEKVRFKSVTSRSPFAMRRHASSSFLFSKFRANETVTTQNIRSSPGFLLYPDDYINEDLSCSHALSGMMQVRVIRAQNLSFSDKKQTRKKMYCAIEVDFERKAFTSAKKATKTPNWDEIFEIEIQHGREMAFLCSTSNKEFDKAVGHASFYLKPLVRMGHTHKMILRLKPEGFLHLELEFTELKTLLQRVPSGKKIGVFGFNLSVTSELERSSIPVIVRKCVNEIEKRGIHTVGLYRISGNARRKEQLRTQFDENSTTVDISVSNCPDINVITGILKDYLRELPEPLITEKMSQDLILAVQENIQDKSPEIKRKFLSKLLSELPDTNRNTLIFILNHLCRVIRDEHNKMDFKSISVCLAPVLQCSPKNISESKDLLNLKMYLETVEVLLKMWNRLERPG